MPGRLDILLVDDDEVDREMARRALTASGIEADFAEAADGASALAALQQRSFDCVLLDQTLPDLDGLAVLQAARAAGVKTPIILLTGDGTEELALETVRAGASDHLAKRRLSRDLLAHSVNHVVRLHRAQSEARLAREQARAVAEASERRYRFLAESIPQQVWTAWPDGRLDYLSRAGLEYFGLAAEELLGDGWIAVVHPDDAADCRRRWARSLRTGEEYEFEFRLRRHDGHYRWHLARAVAQRDAAAAAGGQIIKWFGTNTDIDDQRRHQESLRFLAEASAALASTDDYETTLAAVAKLAVPQVGDWCAIDLVAPMSDDTGGAMRRVAMEHVERAKVALAEEINRRHPPRAGDPFGIARVARTRRPELNPHLSEHQIDASTADDEHATAVRTLGLRSSLAVPLLVRGRAVGVISFATTDESGRRYAEDDVALAEDLARRCAAAIDNAMLNEALRASERRFRVVAEGIPQLVWTTLPDGSCDYLSAQWVRFTGVPEHEQLGLRWLNVLHPDDVGRAREAWLAAVDGRAAYDLEYRIRRHDGVYRWFQTRGVPLRDEQGRTVKWFGTCTDIDDRKRFEEELREAKDAAEAERSRAEAERERAEAANVAKDRFLAVLSHELRTPLTPVLSTVQAIESEPDLPDAMRPSIEMIKRNVELEARLIDDLLDLTRVARGKLELNVEVADAHEAMRHAIDICRDEVGGKGLRLHAELAANLHHVRADTARLQQVFWNLIKNAVKFTPSGGQVWIRTENFGEDDGEGANGDAVSENRLRVEVRDSGIGIEPHILGRIFDAFEQGERSITRRFGGLGLGLAISKALMDAQDGRLMAASEGKDRGATFTVELPTVPVPASPQTEPACGRDDNGQPRAVAAAAVLVEGTAAGAAAAVKSLRILLVDDHEDTARAMARLLRRQGHRVTTAHTMSEAVAEYERAGGADLLISDIGLPDGSGLELIRELQRRVVGGGGAKPVSGIALSGFGMEEDVRKSKEAGFFDHLTKPVNFQKLEDAIRAVSAGR